MMPTVAEKPAKTVVNRRKSLAPLKPASKTQYKVGKLNFEPTI